MSGRPLLIAVALACALSAADTAAFQVRVEVRDARGKPFAEASRSLCSVWYPKIHAALFGQRPLPFGEVKVILDSTLTQGIWPFRSVVPAYTDGNTIRVNSVYVEELHRTDPDDFAGMLIHELTHVDQNYPILAGPDWLAEGIADYVRHKYFAKDIEPRLHLDAKGNLEGFELDRSQSDFATQGYDAGYTVTGAFLYWLEVRKEKDIVGALNRALHDRRYSEAMFQQRCGAPLRSLWRDFVAESRASR